MLLLDATHYNVTMPLKLTPPPEFGKTKVMRIDGKMLHDTTETFKIIIVDKSDVKRNILTVSVDPTGKVSLVCDFQVCL